MLKKLRDWRILGAAVLGVVMLLALGNAQVERIEVIEWWPTEVFWVTDAPQDTDIQTKMDQGVVHTGQYIPPMGANQHWKIGVLVPDLTDPWWVAYLYGFMRECVRLNLWCTALNAGGYEHLSTQISQMEDLITQGVDAIVLNPISFEAQTPIVEEAMAAGILVIGSVNDMRTDSVVTKVEISYWQMGYEAGKWVVQDVESRGLTEAFTALMPGPAGAGWSVGIVNGFLTAIGESSVPITNLAVKWGAMDKATQAALAEDILTTFGDKLNYIVGDSLNVSAAVPILEQMGLADQVKLVATAATEEAYQYVRKGKIGAMASDKALVQGALGVDAAVTYLNGDWTVRELLEWPDIIGPIPSFFATKDIEEFPIELTFAPSGWEPVFNVRPSE